MSFSEHLCLIAVGRAYAFLAVSRRRLLRRLHVVETGERPSSRIVHGMSDSLLDEALRGCHEILADFPASPERRRFEGRVDVLERAAWAMELSLVTEDEVIHMAKLVMGLREEIAHARCASYRDARG